MTSRVQKQRFIKKTWDEDKNLNFAAILLESIAFLKKGRCTRFTDGLASNAMHFAY